MLPLERARILLFFAIQTLSRYSTKFGHVHWNAVKRVFSYLKGTKELWLTYGHAQTELIGYADTDGSTAEAGMPCLGMHSSSMEGQYPGVQNVSLSYRCLQQKAST